MMNVLIGTDPEVFVKNPDGRIISAHGMVQGTKEKPFKVEGGAVQVDGMALEFNIDPAENLEQFLGRVKGVQAILADMVKEHGVLAPIPTAHFTPEYMATQPAEALELGCEPDYNAYTGKANPRPNGEAMFRTGAGHIHIGWCENEDPYGAQHFEDCRIITKVLDAVLLPLSVLWDGDEERRQLYGAKGAFRPKSYGVEYRVLSNAWLCHENVTKFVYKICVAITEMLLEKKEYLARYVKGFYDLDDIVAKLIDNREDNYSRNVLKRRSGDSIVYNPCYKQNTQKLHNVILSIIKLEGL